MRPIRLATRVWREWCFFLVVIRHVGMRLVAMLVLLLGGGVLFHLYERQEERPLLESIYFTFLLIFGEPPERFPRETVVLQALFFLVPILGLTVIIEGIIDFSLMLRDRRRHERSWCKMMASSMHGHIIVVGLGRLGYRTFLLLRSLSENVVVIERDASNQFLEIVRREGSPLLIGDARRDVVLADAHVERARSIVLATDDDLANLEVALDARAVNPDICVVMRMFDQNMADKIRGGFNIHLAMSQSAIAAPAFAASAVEPSIVASMILGETLVVSQRWTVRAGGPLHGRTIGAIMSELGFSVLHRRSTTGPPQVCPPPETRLEAGDEVILQGPFDKLRSLRATGSGS